MAPDIALRAAGAATLLLTAAVLLASAPRSAVARAFAAFALGLAGFLAVNTAFEAAEPPAPWWAIASFFSRMAALALWWFCLTLFDARPRAAVAAGVAIAWTALVVIDKGYLAPAPAFEVGSLQLALATALVVHAGWQVLRDLRGDLLERRRRARPVFALALLAVLAVDLSADVVQGFGWRPAAFLAWQNGAILAIAAGLALWLLRADAGLVSAPPAPAPARSGPRDPEAAILARVEAVMRESRPYLDPGLTIARFAALAGVPEPTLRRAINHRLGHGHFRQFLNVHRVAEAQRRLRDPASAGSKILAIALDSGFASLASFNRAFRQIAGVSPSEYRDGAC